MSFESNTKNQRSTYPIVRSFCAIFFLIMAGHDDDKIILRKEWLGRVETDPRFIAFSESREKYWVYHDSLYETRKKYLDPIAKRDLMLKENSTNFFYETCFNMMRYLLEYLVRHDLSSVLNLCGAPGGFCQALLENDETTLIDLFTLPEESKGVPMKIEDERILVNKFGSEYGDIVKLASLRKGLLDLQFL